MFGNALIVDMFMGKILKIFKVSISIDKSSASLHHISNESYLLQNILTLPTEYHIVDP